MKIESIEVIPMAKESKWEDAERIFEVSMITTDYVTWFTNMYDSAVSYNNEFVFPKLDETCLSFAKKQQAFMLGPTAIFGPSVYVAKSRSADTLDGVVIDGPLYRVEYAMTDDTSAEKTVERKYIDPVTFLPMDGLWYPQKKTYKVRYGQVMNVQG
jgi:hypothetical protein